MQASLSECPVCSFEYTSEGDITPKSLTCGHTICLKCLSDIIDNNYGAKCPLDRKPLQYTKPNDFATNILVIQLLEERRKAKTELCSTHQEPNVFLRVEDKTKICGHCFYLDHGAHDIRHIEELKNQANEKVNQLQWIETELSMYQSQIQAQLDEKKNSILKDIEMSYGKMHEDLYKKEKRLRSEVSLFFTQQRQIAERRLDQDYIKVADIQKLIKDLNAFDFTDNFLECLEKKFEKIPTEVLKTTTDDIQENLEDKLSKMFEDNEYDKDLLDIGTGLLEIKKIDDEIKISPKLVQSQESLSKEHILEIKTLLSEAKSIRLTNSQLSSSTDFFESLCAIWEDLKVMSSLSIELPCNREFSEQTVSALCANDLRDLKGVTDFTLDLQACENVSEMAVFTLLDLLLAQMKDLKTMNLALNSIRMAGENVSIMGALEKALTLPHQCFTSVRTISLHLQEDGIKDQDIKSLSSVIGSSMKYLESLTLHLDAAEVTDSGVTELFRRLGGCLDGLKYLEVGLSGTKVTKKSFEAFIMDFVPKMKNLNMFVLCLQDTKVEEE